MRLVILIFALALVFWLSTFLGTFQYVLISTAVMLFVSLAVSYIENAYQGSKFIKLLLSLINGLAYGVPIGFAVNYEVDLIPLAIALLVTNFLSDEFQQFIKNRSIKIVP